MEKNDLAFVCMIEDVLQEEDEERKKMTELVAWVFLMVPLFIHPFVNMNQCAEVAFAMMGCSFVD